METITVLYVLASIPVLLVVPFEIYDWIKGVHPLQNLKK